MIYEYTKIRFQLNPRDMCKTNQMYSTSNTAIVILTTKLGNADNSSKKVYLITRRSVRLEFLKRSNVEESLRKKISNEDNFIMADSSVADLCYCMQKQQF